MIEQYWNFFVEHYGWQGVALAAAILALLGIQIYYYAIAYARIAKYRNDRRPRRIESNTPEISVIVTLYNENSAYLESGLLQLLSQEYSPYEVVVVYVGSDNDFYEDLSRMRLYYPNLRTTKIEAKTSAKRVVIFLISPHILVCLSANIATFVKILNTRYSTLNFFSYLCRLNVRMHAHATHTRGEMIKKQI